MSSVKETTSDIPVGVPMAGDYPIDSDSNVGERLLGGITVDYMEANSNIARSGWQRFTDRVKNTAYGTAVAIELNPMTNEGARGTAFAATLAASGNPYLAAGVFAASTMAIEGTGSVAAANLLGTTGGRRFTEASRSVLGKLGLSDIRTNNVTESASVLALGTPLTIALKQHQDPSRTPKQNRRYGLIASASLSVATGAASFAVAEGITAAESMPQKVAIGVLALGGLVWGSKKLLQLARRTGVSAESEVRQLPQAGRYQGRHRQ